MALTYFEISYPNFVLGSIIDPVEANQNNNDIVTKTNLIVDAVNLNETNIYDAMVSHKTSGDHDDRYYTKDYLIPWLQGGDTNIKEEIFIITTSNNGDGTFTYSTNDSSVTGVLDAEGYQIFTLTNGYYELGTNRIECWVGDTLRRSVSSGGLKEVDGTHIALSPEGSGAEITFKYYERVGMTAEYTIKMSATKPPSNNGKNMWFEVIG